MNRLTRTIGLSLILVVIVGCAGAAPSAPTAANRPAASPSAPKILNLVGSEPTVLGNFPGVRGGTGSREGIPNELLTAVNPQGEVIPRLAAEVISVENGTWRINPDGTMDTVWKLRPNAKWQDGTPFTAEDLMFTFTAYKDPELPSFYGGALNLMTSAEVIDPYTFAVRWSRPYFQANLAPGLDPIAKHIMEQAYLTDKLGFDSHPYFRQEFVGTGPYRIKEWVGGAHITYERNEHYYLGRPPLDTVIFHFIKDKNTVLANVLAGSLDVVFHKDALDTDGALEVKNRWAQSGGSVTFLPTERLISLEFQFRKDVARPQFGGLERDAREAMLRAIDRAALVESVTHGLAPVADHWIPPNNAMAEAARTAVPRYDYDVARAQQLLTNLGWVRGSDGILVHQTTGERFDFDLWNRFQLTKEQTIVADNWKTIGINTNIRQYQQNDRQQQAGFTGGQTMDQTIQDFTVARLRTTDIAGEANRFTGRNVSGYSNPRFDELLTRLHSSIDAREHTTIHLGLAREAFTDLAQLPLYFLVTPLVVREGWSAPQLGGPAGQLWDIYSWDRRS